MYELLFTGDELERRNKNGIEIGRYHRNAINRLWHKDRLTDPARPPTITTMFVEVHCLTKTYIRYDSLCWGGLVKFTIPREIPTDYPVCTQAQNLIQVNFSLGKFKIIRPFRFLGRIHIQLHAYTQYKITTRTPN